MKGSGHDRVLVVGAGPVGLTAGLLLAQRGVPVTIIESEATLTEDIRASGFHPPTLDLLEESGLTAALLTRGRICRELQYRDHKLGKIVEFDYSVLKNDTRHPYRLQCEQFKLTHWAAGAFLDIPGSQLLYSHRLLALASNSDFVQATIAAPDGTRTISAKYVIGADGGRSTTRKAADISFQGFTYPERFLVIGTPADFKQIIPDLCSLAYVADPNNSYSLFQNPDIWKVGFLALPETVTDEEAMSETNVEKQLQAIAPQSKTFVTPLRGVFHVHQRVADSYRSGRVFLAGDAAHINNPAGGMGMNGGIHDAVNLATRLARVWHGQASDSELDGYEAERRPLAIGAIAKQTDRNHRDLTTSNADRRQRVLEDWRRMSKDKNLQYQHMLQVSMIGPLRQSGMIQ